MKQYDKTVRKSYREEGKTRLRDKDIQLCCMLIGTNICISYNFVCQLK